MVLISLSFVSNKSYAKEDTPSFELLELLGQFEQKDESWFDNELKIDNDVGIKSDIKNEMNSSTQKIDKSRLGESINE